MTSKLWGGEKTKAYHRSVGILLNLYCIQNFFMYFFLLICHMLLQFRFILFYIFYIMLLSLLDGPSVQYFNGFFMFFFWEKNAIKTKACTSLEKLKQSAPKKMEIYLCDSLINDCIFGAQVCQRFSIFRVILFISQSLESPKNWSIKKCLP